nr:MAG TPA: hypothetical protein [Caudoviricetes sp.]
MDEKLYLTITASFGMEPKLIDMYVSDADGKKHPTYFLNDDVVHADDVFSEVMRILNHYPVEIPDRNPIGNTSELLFAVSEFIALFPVEITDVTEDMDVKPSISRMNVESHRWNKWEERSMYAGHTPLDGDVWGITCELKEIQ